MPLSHGYKHGITGDSGESVANFRGTRDVIRMGCRTCSQCMTNALSTSSHAHTQLNRCKTRASVGAEFNGTQGAEVLANISGIGDISPLRILFTNIRR
jgi:hypothetical protein